MASYQLRLDPWTAEFEGPVQLGDEEPAGRVDLSVETRTWRAVQPGSTPLPRRAAFVDGVRRVELRLLIEDGERTVFGLLGSFGVGAVEVGERAAVGHDTIGRVAIAGGGLALDPVEVVLGGRPVRFVPETVPENTPVAPLDGLQAAMRRSEAALAERLTPERDVVFLDGPLSYVTQAYGPLVGYVKRLLQNYLDPEPAALLRRLEVGERTPVFLIEGTQRAARYSWYLRLGRGRAVDTALAGVVRLETSGALDLARVTALADLSARYVPRFASDPARDSRAPQNLYPIGGLEARLRHLLGDPLLLRRAIEEHVHDEVTARPLRWDASWARSTPCPSSSGWASRRASSCSSTTSSRWRRPCPTETRCASSGSWTSCAPGTRGRSSTRTSS